MDIPAVSDGDVLRRIVIRIHLRQSRHSNSLSSRLSSSLHSANTADSCTRDCLHEQRRGFHLVLHEFHELRIHPLLELRPAGDVLADVVKILEKNAVYIRVLGFHDEVVGAVMQPLQRPIREATADGLNREVSWPCARLLQAGTAFLGLLSLVGTPDELSCGGDGERASHVQVNTENHSVLGTIMTVAQFLPFVCVTLVVSSA
jgi:hypothetical protein